MTYKGWYAINPNQPITDTTTQVQIELESNTINLWINIP